VFESCSVHDVAVCQRSSTVALFHRDADTDIQKHTHAHRISRYNKCVLLHVVWWCVVLRCLTIAHCCLLSLSLSHTYTLNFIHTHICVCVRVHTHQRAHRHVCTRTRSVNECKSDFLAHLLSCVNESCHTSVSHGVLVTNSCARQYTAT